MHLTFGLRDGMLHYDSKMNQLYQSSEEVSILWCYSFALSTIL